MLSINITVQWSHSRPAAVLDTASLVRTSSHLSEVFYDMSFSLSLAASDGAGLVLWFPCHMSGVITAEGPLPEGNNEMIATEAFSHQE